MTTTTPASGGSVPASVSRASHPAVSKFMRWPVEMFARAMEQRLRKHDARGGFDKEHIGKIDVYDALDDLRRSMQKVEHALLNDDDHAVLKAAADCGNYAMMIYAHTEKGTHVA